MGSLLISLALLTASTTTWANTLGGQLVSAPSSIMVVTPTGEMVAHEVTRVLNTGSIHEANQLITLTHNRMWAPCGDYLGQLAQDFTFTVLTKEGPHKTVTIKAQAEDREVAVYGMCAGKTKTPTQIQIHVKKGSALEVL